MDGRRFAIKEALTGEPAVAAQGVTKDSRYLTAEQMLAELDKIFMPKTESALAKREFLKYKQHPEEPVIMCSQERLDSTRHGLASRYVRR